MRRTADRINFTKAAIEAIEAPTDRERIYVYDTRIPGLALAVFKSGAKVFYVYRKIDGMPERIKLTKWPEISIDEARRMTAQHLGSIATGVNPNEARRTRRGDPTLSEAFEDFILRPTRTKAKRPKAARTVKEYRQQFNAYLKAWHDRRVTKITRREIEALHNSMAATNGFYIANRVLELIKVIYNTLLEDGFVQANPAARLREFEEQTRDRFLQADELPRFWKALEAEPSEKVRDFIKLALLTGQRRSNVAAMRWEDLNLSAETWTMPQTKTGKHEVPLSYDAVAILKRRQKASECPWVFPAHHGGGHLKDPMRAWRSILKRAGITNLRVHDLRRTMGSWQTKTGASRPIVGKLLGHRREETTAIYGRLDLEPVRESVTAATNAMMKAAKPAKKKRD